MHDHNFEKQVQEKMQELRFAPGEEVWTQVQARIQKKKRRRPIVIFWMLLAGLLIGGGGYFSFVELGKEKKTETTAVIKKTPGIINTPAITKASEPTKKSQTTKASKTIIKSSKPTVHFRETQLPVEVPQIYFPEPHLPGALAKADLPSTNKLPNPKAPITPTENKPPKKQNKNNSWQWGVTAGAGVSDLGMQLFKSTSVVDFAYANNPGGSAVPPPNQPNYGRPSDINPGLALQLGGYVSKGISKKLAVKLGLNYEYYSNSISVGAHYNAPRAVNQGSMLNMVSQYYDRGNETKFTNKYHFVSLPLHLQWKLNKNPKHGIVWENGVSMARMVAANALHYDGISGTYYEDDNLFNKTQWIASSSLLFTIKSKNKLQLYAGPQLQYGISNIVDGSTGNNNHLRYAGLKIMAGFNKK